MFVCAYTHCICDNSWRRFNSERPHRHKRSHIRDSLNSLPWINKPFRHTCQHKLVHKQIGKLVVAPVIIPIFFFIPCLSTHPTFLAHPFRYCASQIGVLIRRTAAVQYGKRTIKHATQVHQKHVQTNPFTYLPLNRSRGIQNEVLVSADWRMPMWSGK